MSQLATRGQDFGQNLPRHDMEMAGKTLYAQDTVLSLRRNIPCYV